MKYLFLLGRNLELSKQEVFSYFENQKNKIISFELLKNALLVDLENLPDKSIIDDFGGVISMGRVFEEGNIKNIFDKIDKRELYFGKNNKLNYVLWDFVSDNSVDEVSDYLKKRFRQEKIKATEKPFSGNVSSQDGENFKKVNSKNIDEEFFIFGNSKNLFFGKILEKYDYEKVELRDMKKPFRRESLAISPRLAKIMINLSQPEKNGKILDPFCGIGVILQEALIKNFNVFGIDKDFEAIQQCKKNMEWFNFQNSRYKIINGDSSKTKINEKISAIVTEPDLGRILKKIPTNNEAVRMLSEFENLIIRVIRNFKDILLPKGKIVFTSPFIKINSGKRISCNFERISEETGLTLAKHFPIDDFRENQIVGRKIIVLEKN